MSIALHNDLPVQLKNTNSARLTFNALWIHHARNSYTRDTWNRFTESRTLDRTRDTKSFCNVTFMPNFLFTFSFPLDYVSDRHSLIVLSFSKLALAIIFSVGWQAVQRTWNIQFTFELVQGLLFFTAAGSKSHHIGVSGQLLHNFLGLQVPNVNLMIR